MPDTGMTLKQIAAQRFYEALRAYEVASKDSRAIVAASVAVYCARRCEADRTAINRVWREVTHA